LWLGTAVVALAVSVGLARNPTEEAVVAIVGLVVCALVFVSVVSRILSGRSRSREVNGESVAALDVPLALLLVAAFLAFCTSVVLWFLVDKSHGIFVGLWVPSILALAAVMLLIRRARRP
jgi:cbb3-type cytochrome oxidase subunit 1